MDLPIGSIAALLAAIFFVLGALHVAWAVRGGTASAVIPTVEGKPQLRPGPLSTLVVAGLLFAAALVALRQGGLVGFGPQSLARWGTWALAILFALRAIGDFRLVGFFKRIRGTAFARNDTRYFSPLCLLISALATCLALAGR